MKLQKTIEWTGLSINQHNKSFIFTLQFIYSNDISIWTGFSSISGQTQLTVLPLATLVLTEVVIVKPEQIVP